MAIRSKVKKKRHKRHFCHEWTKCQLYGDFQRWHFWDKCVTKWHFIIKLSWQKWCLCPFFPHFLYIKRLKFHLKKKSGISRKMAYKVKGEKKRHKRHVCHKKTRCQLYGDFQRWHFWDKCVTKWHFNIKLWWQKWRLWLFFPHFLYIKRLKLHIKKTSGISR